MRNFVGICLALEFSWLLFELHAPGHPAACLTLIGAVALWPALRIAFAKGPIRALVAALVLLPWPPRVFWAATAGASCLNGAFGAESRAQTIVTFNALLLGACLMIQVATRAVMLARLVAR